MGYKTTSFSQAQSAYDHIEEPNINDFAREEWAYNKITEALYGDEKQHSAMLKFLGVDEEEYREEYLGNPDALADEYVNVYIEKMSRAGSEY